MTISTWMSIFVVAATITLWATASLAEYLVALLFFVAALCLRLAPAEIVLSGFSSAAFWLVLSGFVLGVAIRKVGLADRLAHALAVCLTGSWSRMVGGVVLLTYALAFLMPSNMGRIALLMPIVMALADRAGLSKGSPGRIALTLAVGFGTFQLSGSILPANVPNLFMAGAAENAFGLHLSYLSYLLLHAPVIGFLKGSALVLCLCLLFPATLKLCVSQEHTKPLTQAEKRLGLLLLITLSLWATDTLHGISPAWIGLAAACICLMPRIGFINGDEFATGVNIRTCIYVAGILGLASLVNYSGLGSSLGKALHLILPLDPAHSASSFGGLVLLASALNFVVTGNFPFAVADCPDGVGDEAAVPPLGLSFVEPWALADTRHNSLIRSICASVVKSLPAMRSITSLPRKASLRSPELVIDPSGNANEAAVDNRIGSLGLTSLRRVDDAVIVARSQGPSAHDCASPR